MCFVSSLMLFMVDDVPTCRLWERLSSLQWGLLAVRTANLLPLVSHCV